MSVNGPVEQVALADWGQLLGLNVLGMVRGLRGFLPDTLSRGAGHVVFTTSSLALFAGHPHAAAAVVRLAQSVERSLAPHGIGVTLFAPDYTRPRSLAACAASARAVRGRSRCLRRFRTRRRPSSTPRTSCWRRSTGARSSRRRPREGGPPAAPAGTRRPGPVDTGPELRRHDRSGCGQRPRLAVPPC
ncbi:SDR family NAD(P)-dependent oxidoreductase [Streptomyces asiaticus]